MSHPPALYRSVRSLALPLILLAAGSGCSEPQLPPIQANGTLTSLLARPNLREIVTQREDFPVRQDLYKPRGWGDRDFAALPAVEMSPPCEIRYQVPETHPRAVFQFATCVRRRSYLGEGQVHFEFELDGEVVHREVRSSSKTLPDEERHWYRAEFPLGDARELVIRSRYEGDQEEAPRAALALLRISLPFEVERLPADSDEPNVVVILIDTLRADRLHAYGHEVPTSPVMDALAERGMRYDGAYSATPWTIPSTASVLTGMNPAEHGLGFSNSTYLADSLTTLAEAFQYGGFTTAAFACNPLIAAARSFDQGFEFFEPHGWIDGEKIFDGIEAWVRGNVDKRFFLYLHFVEPHYSYAPVEPFRSEFAGAVPEGYQDVELMQVMPEWYADPEADRGKWDVTRDYQLKLYDAEVAQIDALIGQLVDLLGELGVGGNTIIAVTSDHGEEFLEHGWAGHHNQLYDESVRVPLILAGPGIPEGVVRTERVENRHLGGTLLGLCGLEIPRNLKGPDLVNADPRSLENTPVFLTTTKGNWIDPETRERRELGQLHSVIHENWRLIWFTEVKGGKPFFALYDLSVDPDSHHDVAAENPRRVESMKRLIANWIKESKERQPELVPQMGATVEELRKIGYIGDDE